MELAKARALADEWIGTLAPFCERIEIAGGIRRGKPDPHDIEIVCIPRFADGEDLFGNWVRGDNLLEGELHDLWMQHEFEYGKDGPRFKQLRIPEGTIDLFIVLAPAQWGVLLAIRTGPADYSQWLVTPKVQGGALPSYLTVHDGALRHGKEVVKTPEESDFYRALGLPWVEPAERVAQWPKARLCYNPSPEEDHHESHTSQHAADRTGPGREGDSANARRTIDSS